MSTVLTNRMTLAEFHALPDDPAVDRELLFGELVERPVTKRNRWHARAETRIASILDQWCRSQSPPPGEVFSGEAGYDLPEIDTGVGIDVAFFSQDVLDAQDEESPYLVGPPVLAVEILSPSDTVEDMHRKVKAYLQAGVKVVWIVDPYDRTVTVYRPQTPPTMFAEGQDLNDDPNLPGLTVSIDEVFE